MIMVVRLEQLQLVVWSIAGPDKLDTNNNNNTHTIGTQLCEHNIISKNNECAYKRGHKSQ